MKDTNAQLLEHNGNFDVIQMPLPHYSDRGDATPKAIVMQCIGTPLQDIYSTYDKYEVSPHFFIPQATAAEMQKMMPETLGEMEFEYPNSVPILMFVSSEDRAWAVGKSNFADFNKEPGCESGLNSCSITISFHSPGYGEGGDWFKFGSYTDGQKDAGIKLLGALVEEYGINPMNVFGHSTISSLRMTTPGKNFFWKDLNKAGYGYLPTPKEMDKDLSADEIINFVQGKLNAIGFNDVPLDGKWGESTEKALSAFLLQYGQDLLQGDDVFTKDHLEGEANVDTDVLAYLNGFDESIFHNLDA